MDEFIHSMSEFEFDGNEGEFKGCCICTSSEERASKAGRKYTTSWTWTQEITESGNEAKSKDASLANRVQYSICFIHSFLRFLFLFTQSNRTTSLSLSLFLSLSLSLHSSAFNVSWPTLSWMHRCISLPLSLSRIPKKSVALAVSLTVAVTFVLKSVIEPSVNWYISWLGQLATQPNLTYCFVRFFFFFFFSFFSG